MSNNIFWFSLAGFVVLLLFFTFQVLKQYERGVILFLGKLWGVKEPGLRIVVPFIQQMTRVDIRTRVYDVPSQDIISRDNVSVKVSAVLYYYVFDPKLAILEVEDFVEATSQLAQTTLRSILGQHELDEMLVNRDQLNAGIQNMLDEQTEAWGIKVIRVEIKHVDLDDSMIRAIAKQAEAERERRAKVIHATGELEASEQLLAAANVLAQNPQALQLRWMQTLTEVARDHATIIPFPVPIDLIDSLRSFSSGGSDKNSKPDQDSD